MSLSVLFLILSCVHVRDVRGYPSGAPQSECVAMTPRGPHGASQTTTSPYQITTDALPNGYVPGETYTGRQEQKFLYKHGAFSISKTLPSDSDFRGFLCQVRQVGRTTAVGTFSVRNTLKARTLDCSNENDAVTHTNDLLTSQQLFDWTAPSIGVGTQLEIM
ncbi:defense protein l(2)34Fc-like [Corticium candelabrum]|uniref:defense protein l(2)34Fc-like n=1 Tax=Corticium candelabrum TaxID=121492 RepID=UPI002E2657F3|nr:defense protein l(2)34Fc-like [Corticium candelabrum]